MKTMRYISEAYCREVILHPKFADYVFVDQYFTEPANARKKRVLKRIDEMVHAGYLIGDDLVNICRESALLIASDLVRLDSHLIANIESKLYAYLETLPSYSSLYKNRLDAELAEDLRIMQKI